MRTQIVALQRGFVFVGRTEQIGTQVVIHDARNVRRWGTTEGLIQLAHEGPQSGTVLDGRMAVVRAHELTVMFAIDCDEEKWASHLNAPEAVAGGRRRGR